MINASERKCYDSGELYMLIKTNDSNTNRVLFNNDSLRWSSAARSLNIS